MILCHTATESTFAESVMFVDVWNEQKHAWPLQEAWLTRKRRLKREKKWTRKWKRGKLSTFFSFPSPLFLFLSCFFHVHVHVLLYLRLYKTLSYSNFRIFLSRPSCLQWSTLLSASLRRNLWCIITANHRWQHLLRWSDQLTVDNETSKSWSALTLITKDKTTDSEAMHSF